MPPHLNCVAALPCEIKIVFFASTINANAVIFGHGNDAVFTHLIFVDLSIKINREYVWDVLLKQKMLPDIVQFLATSSLFSKTVHPLAGDKACEMVALLQREVPSFIAANLRPPNSHNLNPVNYKLWGMMQDRIYRAKVRDVDDLKQRVIDV